MMAQRDPWVNMLRTHASRRSAPGSAGGHRCGAAVRCGDRRRLSGHQAGVLPAHRPQLPIAAAEESHIGSGARSRGRFVVRRGPHRRACRPAWSHFQDIEARGFTRGGDHIAAQIEQVRAERSADIAHRRTAITRVNEFPNLSGAAPASGRYPASGAVLPRLRAAAVMRTLERGGSQPRYCCCCREPLAEHNIRTTFAANLLASGGIEDNLSTARRLPE